MFEWLNSGVGPGKAKSGKERLLNLELLCVLVCFQSLGDN